MTTLSERVLALLENEGKPQTNKQIAKQLRLGAREMTALASALTDLNRAKRVRYVNGEGWTKTDHEPSAAPPTRKPAKIERESSPVPTNIGNPIGDGADLPDELVAQLSKPERVRLRPEAADAHAERRPHQVTTDLKRKVADQKARIIELLERHGSLTAPHALELLADPSLTLKDVQNRLTHMRQSGLVEPTGHGYALVEGATHETANAAHERPAEPDEASKDAEAPEQVTSDGESNTLGEESTEQRGGRHLKIGGAPAVGDGSRLPKRHGSRSDLSDAILRALATGPMKRKEIYAQLPGWASENKGKAIDQRLNSLKIHGHIVRSLEGVWSLPSSTMADALLKRGDSADDLPDEYEDGIGLNTREVDSAAEHVEVLTTVGEIESPCAGAGDHRDSGSGPMRDIRAKLMEMVDLRAAGKIDREQTMDMLRILNHVASIDQAAEEGA